MIKFLKGLVFFLLISTTESHATTWDEPWADKVIKEATSFVLAKVVGNDPEKGIRIVVVRTLGGKMLQDTIEVNNFYSLVICSSSGGQGPEFHLELVDSCYFFIKQNLKGQFCIATPTTGFDYVLDGQVMSTFRHSFHQASVPVTVYERAMTAVFNNYHSIAYDKEFIDKFVQENLSKPPAGFGENELSTFFLQHVALECVFHLKLNVGEATLYPFLNDKHNFHNQVSAARAMRAIKSEAGKEELLRVISDTSRRDFVRVMCVWSLAELKPNGFKQQLKELEKVASDDTDGFDSNLMDPRICTRIPSLKTALKDLIEKL